MYKPKPLYRGRSFGACVAITGALALWAPPFDAALAQSGGVTIDGSAGGEIDAGANALTALEQARQDIAAGDFAAARAGAETAAASFAANPETSTQAVEAAAILALAALQPDASTPQELRPLVLALERAESAGVDPDPVLIRGWTRIAAALEGARRWPDTARAAERAIGLMSMLPSPPQELRLAAGSARARAATNMGEYDVASWAYAWLASGLSPIRHENGATITDPIWADFTLRSAAAQAAHLSLHDERAKTPSIPAPQDVAEPPCAPVWNERPDARLSRSLRREYPDQALTGAVLVEFEITPEGGVSNIAVVGSAPAREPFVSVARSAAAEALQDWRADPATLTGCRGVRYVTAFEFLDERRR